MTVRTRIIDYLNNHPDGVDDDDLASKLNLSSRQQANITCRKLEKDGLVTRRRIRGKIHNFLTGSEPKQDGKILEPSKQEDYKSMWFWEGNVQAQVVSFLTSQGCQIRSVADTASKQTGIDIIAEKDGKPVYVTVKGYPKETERTNPSVQAPHWFKDAIFDILKYRNEGREIDLGLALPDFPRYRNLAKAIEWFKPVANFYYFWVRENGEVSIE